MTVFVTEDLEAFKEASRNCRIKLFKVYDYGDSIEVRAKAGTVGFHKEYNKEKKDEVKNLEKWFEVEGFTELLRVEQDDTFFG